jgi:hypothetical protein
MKQNETKNLEKVAQLFECVNCDYKTSRKYNYTKHFSTCKPKIAENETKMKQKVAKSSNNTEYQCELCDKIIYSRTSIWRHKKKCIISQELIQAEANLKEIIKKQSNDINQLTNTIMEVVQHNKLLTQQICELSKEKITNNTQNNCTNNNNNFNIQVFLNENCKDALNMSEFIDSLKIQICDLEETGRLGFAKGISRIFINGLKDIETHNRPIHCGDLKRETFYIKNDNKWEKDSENNIILTKLIKKVANKSLSQIFAWQKENPEYNDPDSKQNDIYNKIIFESVSGSNDEETNKNIGKIIKCIAKETVIHKNIF